MIKFDFSNLLEENAGPHGLSKKDLGLLSALVPRAHQKFLEWRKSGDAFFYDMVFDTSDFGAMSKAAERVADRFANIVVLGIGGSALGLKCAASALLPPFWNLIDRREKPRLFVCDNIDPDSFASLLGNLKIADTCFIIISKSGKTTETAAQFFVILNLLQKTLKDAWRHNLVVITDPKSGELRPFVEKEKIVSFPIPPKLGGRFSVLSAVGLFPAACVGIDIEALIGGAQEMAKLCENGDLEQNAAYKYAASLYLLAEQKSKSISVMMPYSDTLTLTSDWYAQLWAESLGKNGKGQTPVKAAGTTDQHSQVQLYMEGPNDKVFTFIGTDSFNTPKSATRIGHPFASFGYLKGHDLGSILNAELAATVGALTKSGRPNMTVTFPHVNAKNMGGFFMFFEIAAAFSGALYNINPFDQPGVELGKKLTREILTGKYRYV